MLNSSLHIGVGSLNPAKLKAVEAAFDLLDKDFSVDGIFVQSGVSAQPMSDSETLYGSIHRAKQVLEQGNYNIGVGLEGGVDETAAGMVLCNWCAMIDRNGQLGIGAGVRLLLHHDLAEKIRQGHELGDVIDGYTGQKNVRRGEGTIGILTNGRISRSQMFRDAVICAYASLQPTD